jgi:DNA-binding NtrC family response regulator
MPEHIVVVEDDAELRSLLADVLAGAGYDVIPFADGAPALNALRGGRTADLVITDLMLPEMHGDVLLRELRVLRPELNVIIITAFGSIDSAIDLIRAGAFDYVTKPFRNEEILSAVRRALEESRVRRSLAGVHRTNEGPLRGFVGKSPAVVEVLQLVARAGQSRHPVLITGESGTGKEILARAIHEFSGRKRFVTVNCGALPETLVESELFGHERGAFTGAEKAREGLLVAADHGTAFLDEIGELPLTVQPKLLRALERGEIRPVGSNTTRTVDARLVSATNRDLEVEVEAGRFREDLFWRINVIQVPVPPLRDRAEDIPLLVEHFLQEAAAEASGAGTPLRVTPGAMRTLQSYPWPGNVRELRNAVQRAAVLSSTGTIDQEDLPPRIRGTGKLPIRTESASTMSLRDLERAYILDVLRQVDGNKSRAAEILGVDRKTLYRKLVEYGEAGAGRGAGGDESSA